MQTTHPEEMEPHGLETCDLRLTTVDDKGTVAENSDIVLYRMGLYNYHKINFDDGVTKVNSD